MDKKSKIWVLTSEVNDYRQHGRYFETFWFNKPTIEQLKEFFYKNDMPSFSEDDLFLEHLINGGGRIDTEFVWFYLEEGKEGSIYNLSERW